jgi:hypothetical protein
MLKMSQSNGCQWYCDVCFRPLLDLEKSVGLWRPLQSATDLVDVLIVHDTCRDASLTTMLLPKANKGPLRVLLDQSDEVLNR